MKLSIITINFNNSIGLERTIESVIDQEFSDFEYLIVDGASTDDSVDVIKKYENRITSWISEPDFGIYNAMNKGILKAKGEYLLFLNSGDTFFDSTVLSKIFSVSRTSDLIYGDLHRLFPDGQTDIVVFPESVDMYHMFVWTLPHPATFIRRNLFKVYGLYREDLKIVADWAFFLKIFSWGNITREHIPITVSTFSMDGLSSENPSLVNDERRKVFFDTYSLELLEILFTYRQYKSFYYKDIFKKYRSFKELFLPKYWYKYIHEKKINFLISVINKTVKQQNEDLLSIPVIIINYNRLLDLSKLVDFLIERKHKNIVIIDNNSSYPPLLNYYKEMENKITIERLDINYGHMVFWKNQDLYNKYCKGYYIVSDSDVLPNPNLPANYVSTMKTILDKYKEIEKVGFALRIDNIPDYYSMKEKVVKWESQFWQKEISKDVYYADVDTTFALYRPYSNYKMKGEHFFKGIRLAGNFMATHQGWYIDPNNLSEEELFYSRTANNSSSWKYDAQGNFVGHTIYD